MDYLDAHRSLHAIRGDGYLHVAVAHETFDPDLDGVDFRVFLTADGFRTWAFRDKADWCDFRRRYTQAAPRA